VKELIQDVIIDVGFIYSIEHTMFVATSNCAKKRLANSRYVWTIEN
jgi:hypothetical protein